MSKDLSNDFQVLNDPRNFRFKFSNQRFDVTFQKFLTHIHGLIKCLKVLNTKVEKKKKTKKWYPR